MGWLSSMLLLMGFGFTSKTSIMRGSSTATECSPDMILYYLLMSNSLVNSYEGAPPLSPPSLPPDVLLLASHPYIDL
jgi:hypothetical protein